MMWIGSCLIRICLFWQQHLDGNCALCSTVCLNRMYSIVRVL